MQQCDQRFLYPTQSNNNNNSNNNQANPNQLVQYQVLTQQHLNPQQAQTLNQSHLNKNIAPSTSQAAAAGGQLSGNNNATLLGATTNQVEDESNSNSSNVLGSLPDGWERRYDQNGRSYFVNHKNKTTQWQGMCVCELFEKNFINFYLF